MATGPELFREAERLRQQAAEWMDIDWGWKGKLSAEERLAFRLADLAEAQVCATLAAAAATAMGTAPGGMGPIDLEAWDKICGAQEDELDDESIDAGEEWELAEREHGNWLAAESDDEQAGTEIDKAVEFTGHLPGHADADPLANTPLATAFGAVPVEYHVPLPPADYDPTERD